MKPSNQNKYRFSLSATQGFSLIELLIGLVISLIATLAISNVFSQFESGKRRIGAGADAQTNASLAVFSIQRDLQNAGYGLPVFKKTTPFNCPLSTKITQDTIEMDLSPVLITDGGNTRDEIRVRYGTASLGGAYIDLTSITINGANANGMLFENTNIKQFTDGDVILLQDAEKCSLGKATVNATSGALTGVTSLTTAIGNDRVVTANPTTTTVLANLGQWNEYKFKIEDSYELSRTGGYPSAATFPDKTAVPIVSGIVALQAQYGVSDAALNTNRIANWVDATDDFAIGGITLAKRNLIKAVRVAVVAQDGAMQKTNVSQACNGAAAGLNKVCIWINDTTPKSVDLSAIPNWQRYRYKVYETAIPLRNVLWNFCEINPASAECS